MKLWLLRPINPKDGPWDPWYDKCFGFVIRASSAEEARTIASDKMVTGDEDYDNRNGPEMASVWLDPELVRCEPLLPDGEAGIIIRDFAAA